MNFLSPSLYRFVAGLAGLLLAPLALHAQQTINATAGTVGVAYSYQVTSNATPPIVYGASGLPAGLAINASSGLITGTPTTPGTVVGSVSVTSNGLTNNANISIAINAAAGTPIITSTLTATGTVGAAFTYTTLASPAATSFNITGLPAGLSADAAGVISGTPTVAGASSVSLSGNNASGVGATKTLAITIGAPSTAPAITSAANASVAVGAGFSYNITATNTPTSFGASGLPIGLSVDTVTGAITGTPTVAGVYSVGLSATNGAGTSAAFNLSITVGALSVITSATTSDAPVNIAYTYTVTANPAATSFNISGLPAGLTANTSTGVISGTPTVVGVSSVSLSANNATGSGPVTTLTLSVGNRPTVTSAATAIATVGVPFTYTITASNTPTSFGATGLPAGLSLSGAVISGTTSAVGTSTVSLTATNAFGTGDAKTLSLTVSNPAPTTVAPLIATQPQNTSGAVGASITLTATATGTPAPTFQWRKNGVNIAGATSASLTLGSLQVSDAGSYNVVATNSVGSATSQTAVVGVISTAKVSGAGTIAGADIVHPNGNIYDQILLTGTSAAITADANKVTRISFLDLNDDIVQVEMSGAGTLTLSLENATGPAPAVKYNQPTVSYMKGHASIVITGANQSTNLTVFTVGTTTAVNQGLFKAGEVYDGVADMALISIASADAKFAGIRAANANFFATTGRTGIDAPGVTVAGATYVGDINADGTATGTLRFAAAADVRVTGGDLLQLNNRAVQVDGFTTIRFTAGTRSSGTVIPAQVNQARFEKNGVDITSTIILTN